MAAWSIAFDIHSKYLEQHVTTPGGPLEKLEKAEKNSSLFPKKLEFRSNDGTSSPKLLEFILRVT